MSTRFTVEGLREIQSRLRALEAKTAKKDVRKALRAGAKVIAEAAAANAPRDKGLMGKSVVVRGGRKGGDKGMIRVTITYNKKLYAGLKRGFYADYRDQGHFAGRRISKAAFKQASNSVNWSSDKAVRTVQNLSLYAQLSRAKGRKFIPGSKTLAMAAELRAQVATEKFVETLRQLIEESNG